MLDRINTKGKVIIYAGDDHSTLKTLNALVPGMLSMGLTPVIAFPKAPKLKPEFQSAALDEFVYFDRTLLNEVIIPAMDEYEPLLNSNGLPKKNVDYTPKGLLQIYPGTELYNEENPSGLLTSVNSQRHIDYIAKNSDVIGGISIRCLQIFHQPVIDQLSASEDGFLWNLHPGRLPYRRGILPIFRAMSLGDQTIDWTLHRIVDKQIDMGPVIHHATQRVNHSESVLYHYNSHSSENAAMLLRYLGDVVEGRHERKIKNSDKGEYFTTPTANEIEDFKNKGGRMVGGLIKTSQDIAADFTNGSSLRHEIRSLADNATRIKFDLDRPQKRTTHKVTFPLRVEPSSSCELKAG
jgi:methionyl-tRNA formyltransferase